MSYYFGCFSSCSCHCHWIASERADCFHLRRHCSERPRTGDVGAIASDGGDESDAVGDGDGGDDGGYARQQV